MSVPFLGAVVIAAAAYYVGKKHGSEKLITKFMRREEITMTNPNTGEEKKYVSHEKVKDISEERLKDAKTILEEIWGKNNNSQPPP